MKNSGQFFKDPLSLILAALVSLSLLGAWDYAKKTPGLDYYVAWVAADAVKNDNPNSIYEPSSRYTLAVLYRNKADAVQDAPRQKQIAAYRKQLPMTATPFLYWVTGMLASGDYEKDLTRWHLLSMILLTVSILVMCRLMGYSPATSLGLLLPVLVWFSPFYSDLRVGNVNSFQIGMIGLIVWLQSRQSVAQSIIAAGFVAGLLVMFKPNLAPIAVLIAGGWVVRRQFTNLGLSIGGMVAGAVMALLLSSLWLGSATIWLDWLGVIQQVVDGGPGKSGGNYAIITQFLNRPGPLGQLIAAVLLCTLCLVLFWWGRRGNSISGIEANGKNLEFIENTCLVAMGCLVTMLASTIVWIHYYLLAIPMFIVLFRPWQEPGRIKTIPFLMLRVLPLIALIVLMKTALNTLLSDDGRSYWSAATTSCALILFVAGLWQFGYGIRSRPDPKADGGPDAH